MSDVITTELRPAETPGEGPQARRARSREDPSIDEWAVVTAVDHVTFDVRLGEFLCLLGPSGCGKTSILNVLAGLDEPTSGEALLDGHPITRPGPDRAVLFQEPALFPWPRSPATSTSR